MKSLLVIIVCALLLSSAEIGGPSDEVKHAETAAEAGNKDRPSQPRTVPNEQQPAPHSSADVNKVETYNYYGDFNYVSAKAPAKENIWVRNSAAISGISTIVVAFFTGALFITSWKQWQATKLQAEIAQKTLTGIERPLVLLHSIAVQNSLKTLTLQFENVGRTPAFIRKLVCTHTTRTDDLPSIPTYPEAPAFPPWGILVNGKPSSPFIVNWDQQHQISDDQLLQIRAGTLKYYVFGYIDYADGAGNQHRAGFANVFRPTPYTTFPIQGTFDVVNSAAYNYST